MNYTFIGFLAPVDNPPIVNVGKAGRTYPIKWQLKDAQNIYVTALSTYRSLTYKKVTCGSFDGVPTDAMNVEATGTTGIRYDSVANQFVFNWATPSSPGCYQVFLTLTDDSVHQANFNMSK